LGVSVGVEVRVGEGVIVGVRELVGVNVGVSVDVYVGVGVSVGLKNALDSQAEISVIDKRRKTIMMSSFIFTTSSAIMDTIAVFLKISRKTFFDIFNSLTAGVTRVWAGVDNA
jgi:hypothetical protein